MHYKFIAVTISISPLNQGVNFFQVKMPLHTHISERKQYQKSQERHHKNNNSPITKLARF